MIWSEVSRIRITDVVRDRISLIVRLGFIIKGREEITPPGFSCTRGVELGGLS
jgi:hypothetical protein